jgi:hypothetical protein
MTHHDAPGWDSITAAFAAVYPDLEPAHKALPPGLAFGAPLQGVSAFPGPHGWHFVTYGLTELWTKESEDADLSGWGYELTMLTPSTDEPPMWVFDTLAGLAKSTWETGRPYDPGDRIDILKPIDGGASELTAYAVAEDPLVTPDEFPFGRYAFHRLVGIAEPELLEMKATSTAQVLERLDPKLITDPLRTPRSA